jgi:hypothetical protein
VYCWRRLVGNALHHTYPLGIKSAPASPGRSRAGPALYVFSLFGCVRYAARRSKTDQNGHTTRRTARLDAVFIEL